jgi:dienelactone hydrolase
MLKNGGGVSGARYEGGGWMHWPEYEDYCLQFMRLLAAAQEGASTVSECFLTATRIIPGDDESWHREWKRIADASKARGDRALARGHIETAKSNWLRASNYYRSAAHFLKAKDDRRLSLFNVMEDCSHLYLKHVTPRGEIVKIPHEGSFLYGYFLRAPNAPHKTPVVLCVDGLDQSKDDQLYKLPRHAFGRNLSLLLVDLPGQGATVRRSKLMRRYDQETSISHCVDYLLARGDIDETRIVLHGDGFGGSDATRAAGFDGRFAAAVCDGGIWDHKKRLYLTQWLSGDAIENRSGSRAEFVQRGIASRIACPYLVTIGEHDFLDVKDGIALYHHGRKAGARIDLKIFSAEETGASHGQMDNPTLGKEFIFDWIVTKIGLSCENPAQVQVRENHEAQAPRASTRSDIRCGDGA